MKVLIVGNKGQLGWALERQATINGISTEGADLPELDMTNQEAVKRLVGKDRFSVVVNAAAYTAVDKAESDVDTAFAVNRDGAAYLAEACRENNIPLIHISTDYVFNGTSTVPYKPEDPIDPLGVYGRSKAEGETAIREILPQHVIIRTAWLYGIHGNNFVKTMIRLAKERTELRVVNDQRGCPTFAGDLAEAIMDIIDRYTNEGALNWGTYHYCNSGETTWYVFAEKAIALSSEYEKMAMDKITPISTDEYPTPAPRPAFSALDCNSISSIFGVSIYTWEESLIKMIRCLYAEPANFNQS
jgi:dTDP-4-dehydrorhamnose reductase